MEEQTWPQEAAELSRAALNQARTERPDLVEHLTTVHNYWTDLAKRTS